MKDLMSVGGGPNESRHFELWSDPQGLWLTIRSPASEYGYGELLSDLKATAGDEIDFVRVKKAFKADRGKRFNIGGGEGGARVVLEESPDGWMLTVLPATGERKRLSYRGIIERVKAAPIANVDFVAVKRAFKAASGRPVRISTTGRRSVEKRSRSFEDEARTATASDRLSVILRFTSGIVDVPADLDPVTLDERRWEKLRTQHSLREVRPGHVLAEVKAQSEGISGSHGVGGREERVTNTDRTLVRLDERTVSLSPDGDIVVASVPGQPAVVDGRLTVRQLERVESEEFADDADRQFTASLIVMGDLVGAGSLVVDGDLEVWGDIKDVSGHVSGDLLAKGAIRDVPPPGLRVDGSVIVEEISTARVTVGRDLYVKRSLLEGDVDVAGDLVLFSSHGSVQGGSVRVTGRVHAARSGRDEPDTSGVDYGP